MKARVLIGLAALFAVACSDEEPPAQPGSFDRPSRVAFACFDVSLDVDPQPVALSCCDTTKDAPAGCGSRRALHALVVQSARGEVAAVDLLERRTLDSREDIPGYTFLAVGELPTAIVVPARDGNSQYTYVLASGSRDVTVLKTRAFRTLAAREQATLQTVMLPGDGRDAPLDMVLSPNEDALFVSVPSTGRLLRLPIRRCAASGSEDCVEGEIDAAAITEVDLTQSVARAAPPSAGMSFEPYSKTCELETPITSQPLEVPALPADAATTTPRPSGLALDDFCETDQPCSQRLLVADAALPLIHVVDLAAWQGDAPSDEAVLPPILTGAPTTTVAVTPRVPVSTSPDSGETQYVYAIDANDGSVLVTENGRLLQVGTAGARPDRVTLGATSNLPRALSLAVLTPSFDVHGPAAQYARQADPNAMELPEANAGAFCTDQTHPNRRNTRLRGVFLGVGVTDGTARIIDVHDMDLAECRTCPGSRRPDCTCTNEDCGCGAEDDNCEACAWADYDPYPLVRHRTRIAVTAPPETTRARLAPYSTPGFVVRGDVIGISPSGTTSDPALENALSCVACTGGQIAAYPESTAAPDAGMIDDDDEEDAGVGGADVCDNGQSRVCVLNDPWAELEDWDATYLGVVPGTRSGEGQIERTDGRVEFRSDRRFCALGVLGQDIAASPDDADVVTIVNEPATDAAIRKAMPRGVDEASTLRACKALVSQRDRDADRRPIAFRIREAYDDRLVIEPSLVTRPEDIDSAFEDDVAFVNTCFANARLTHEIRAGQGYIVVGHNGAGFLHRIIAENGTAHCIVDTDQDPRRTGRAYSERAFDNGRVTFQIGRVSPQLDTALVLRLQAAADKTVMNATLQVNDQVYAAIPNDLRWSDTDDILYMVDISERGLVQIPVDPYPVNGSVRTFE